MSTFSERESKENTARKKFEKWLERGGWDYRHFRYPEELTNITIHDIKLKKALKKVNFDHDGIMARKGIDVWLFDLKYKSKSHSKTWVNEDDYRAYYELSKIIGFILVAYVKEEDALYFHKVRNPDEEPKPKRRWDDRPAELGGQKWVLIFPEEEYTKVSDFDIPEHLKKIPENTVDYLAWSSKIQDIYNKKKVKPNEYYKQKAIEELKSGMPKPWLTNPLWKIKKKKKR